jgi:tRNA A22 N-methylase
MAARGGTARGQAAASSAAAEARLGPGLLARAQVPRRVTAIVLACPPAERVCEVGYDRGLILFTLLATRDGAGLGIEVQPDSARATPVPPALRHRVELRTGDGLMPLHPDEADGLGVILAGLGGRTIADILEARPEVTRRLAWVVTCPSHLEADVRPALRRLGLTPASERLVEDRGRFYEVVVAVKADPHEPADEVADMWGPHLIGGPDPLMAAYLDDQERRFAAAFQSGLKSYGAGNKVALGRKLALLGAARERVVIAHSQGGTSRPSDCNSHSSRGRVSP